MLDREAGGYGASLVHHLRILLIMQSILTVVSRNENIFVIEAPALYFEEDRFALWSAGAVIGDSVSYGYCNEKENYPLIAHQIR